jgi:hypothetical protein
MECGFRFCSKLVSLSINSLICHGSLLCHVAHGADRAKDLESELCPWGGGRERDPMMIP